MPPGDPKARRCERLRVGEGTIEFPFSRRWLHGAGVELGDARRLALGQPDPEIETERIGEVLAPVVAERGSARDLAHDLVDQKPEGARVVAVGAAGRPDRLLFFESADDGRVVEDVSRVIEGSEPSLVGQHLLQRDVALSPGREVRPQRGDLLTEREASRLERVQRTDSRKPLGGRPDRHQRVVSPRANVLALTPAGGVREQLVAVLPDRDRRAKFVPRGEVFLEHLDDAR